MHRIIYPQGDGVAVIIPVGPLPVTEIARKDVPTGVPYRIVDVSDIPADRAERDLWSADFGEPDGYGVGAEAWFAEQEAEQ